MRAKFSNLKIHYQFLILTAMAVILVLAVQSLYYIKIANITKEKIKAFTDQSISQTDEMTKLVFEKAKNSASYFAISNAFQIYMETSDPYIKFQMKKYIDDIIKPTLEVNHEIMNVILLSNSGDQKYYYSNTDEPIDNLLEPIRARINADRLEKGFLFLDRGSDRQSYIAYVMSIKYLSGRSRYGDNVGYIAILINPQVLTQIIQKASNPEFAEFYLLDNNGKIVASNHKADNQLMNSNGAGNKAKYIKLVKELSDTGWNITAFVNESEVISDYAFFKSFGILVGVIMVLLLAGMGLSFNKSIADPVLRLHKEIDKMGRDNLKNRISMPYKNEFGDIGRNINRMLDNIEALSRRIFDTQQKMYESELSRKQTELYALQSQVNPHFLFNTLQCIGGIAAARDVMEVSEVAASMAEIFKYSIKGNDKVTIKDELYIVSQYLKIIEIRFAGRFKWSMDIQEEVLELKTIKMILQPLVENAVYHGLEKSYDDGFVRIKAWLDAEYVHVEIVDNGAGIEESRLLSMQRMLEDRAELEREGQRRQRIGIANIQYRIKLILGEAYGLRISSKEGSGTTVNITLPVLKE